MKYGIALSGGGARGIAHLGVLEALEEFGIEPQVISGTSMGSLVGVFYAYGYAPKEILSIFLKEIHPKTIFQSLSLKNFSLQKTHNQHFKRHIPENDFRVLKKPFFVSVANLNKGIGEIMSEGKLFEFVLASCAIPIVFPEQQINNQTYVDGGLFNNLPAEILVDKCDSIIGSHVNFNGEKESFANKKAITERCFQLSIAQNVEVSKKLCSLLIEPPKARKFGTFDFNLMNEIYTIGYEETKRILQGLEGSFFK